MTNATPSSLMRRTKAELVNIILRKDETEAKAAEEIKTLNKKVSEYEANHKKTVDNYKDKVQSIKDSYNDVISTLNADNKKLKNTLIYSYVAFAAIIIIILL
jgi:hypothetical protein